MTYPLVLDLGDDAVVTQSGDDTVADHGLRQLLSPPEELDY